MAQFTEFMPAPKNWQKLTYHPLADIIGFGIGIDVEALAGHIKDHGYDDDEAIVITRDGKNETIIDGRHKHAAAIIAGKTPTFRRFVGKDVEAYVAKKAHRQHLNESQRAMVAAIIATRPHSEKTNTCDGINCTHHDILPSSQSPTNEDAANKMNVSTVSVKRAKKVLNHGTDKLQEAVKDGTLSVSDAAKVADESPKSQDKAVDAVKNGKAETATKATKPKSGNIPFDDSKFEKLYGPLVRFFDDRASKLGRGKHHQKCLDILGELLTAYKEWKKTS